MPDISSNKRSKLHIQDVIFLKDLFRFEVHVMIVSKFHHRSNYRPEFFKFLKIKKAQKVQKAN